MDGELTMKPAALLILFALLGCSSVSYWHVNPAYADFHPDLIRVSEVQSLAACGQREEPLGCSVRFKARANEQMCIVLIKSNLSVTTKDCVLHHEIKHCQGYDHAATPSLALNCGIS